MVGHMGETAVAAVMAIMATDRTAATQLLKSLRHLMPGESPALGTFPLIHAQQERQHSS